MNIHDINKLILTGTLLLLYTIFYTTRVEAQTNLVLPLYTKHIQHQAPTSYTEDFNNTAIGIERRTKYASLGVTYVHKNSHNKHSIYSHAIVHLNSYRATTFGTGLMTAIGGYDKPMIAPVISINYGYLRIITTYPAAKLADYKSDLVNIQLIIPF